MRGVVFLGDRKLELREFPDPTPGPTPAPTAATTPQGSWPAMTPAWRLMPPAIVPAGWAGAR